MEIYFSHSYRDVAINSYFLDHFVREEIPLRADQKTDVWCVAKLERFVSETTGFVSIIPRRPTEQDPGAYSPYIGQELNLARRARVPRLLLVDEQVFKRHQLDFPKDAVTFLPEALEKDKDRHAAAIRAFCFDLEASYPLKRESQPKHATLVVGEGKAIRKAAEDVAEILRRQDYAVTHSSGRYPGRGLEDIRLLEMICRAELCVFLLGERLSDAHIALAIAHAHCIPSVRLKYNGRALDCTPSISGLISWSRSEEMLLEFNRQLTCYEEGLVRPVDMARSSNAADAARAVGTMKWRAPPENEWDIENGPALIHHVQPDHEFIRDEVSRVRAKLGRSLGRMTDKVGSMEVCAQLYDGIRRLPFGYELEQVTRSAATQSIRTPRQIAAHKSATCIDLVCLFASLLEAAGQNPLLLVVEGPGFAHALAGYRVHGEPARDQGIGDLRGAVTCGDAVIFEATGCVMADAPVGEERADDRRDKYLDFMDSIAAAERMIARRDVRLKHYVDVRMLRTGGSQS